MDFVWHEVGSNGLYLIISRCLRSLLVIWVLSLSQIDVATKCVIYVPNFDSITHRLSIKNELIPSHLRLFSMVLFIFFHS